MRNEYFCSLNSIIQLLYFFSDNATIIYWMKETNSWFLRIASKAPVRIQQNLYTAFEWIWRSNQQNLIFFWRVLREKMKIKVSSVKISSKMEHRKYDKFNYVPKKRNYTVTRFHEHFTTGNWLVLFNYHIIHYVNFCD